MSELKPCPFCGGEARFHIYGRTCNVVCDDCRIGTRLEHIDEYEVAVEAWNTRTERTCDGKCDTDCPNADVFTDIIKVMCNRDLEKADPETAALWRKCWPDILTCKSVCGDANVLDSFCSECGEYLGQLGEEHDFCPNCWARVVSE